MFKFSLGIAVGIFGTLTALVLYMREVDEKPSTTPSCTSRILSPRASKLTMFSSSQE